MADEPTVGEVSRRLEEVVTRLEHVIANIDTTYERKDVNKEAREALKARVAVLEDSFKWLARTVGALAIGLLGGLVMEVITIVSKAK
jgi:hypothetical protein